MKRLVLLFDGTWNTEDGATYTNIVRLREILAESLGANRPDGGASPEAKPISGPMVDGIEHLVFYDSGVGTGLMHDRILGGSIGVGITTNIRQGYRFLSRWYVPGDEIYVFGFSRGAYTARSLVGYVAAAGLLQSAYCTWERENEAWSFYRTPPKDRLPGSLAALSPFVHAASQLRIKCLGVFDTVGALGVPLGIARRLNARNHQFHDVVLGSITEVNLHAIAIDERRRPFEAAPWTKPKFQRYKDSGRVEQVWFPGAHADVGGGYPRKDGPDSAALEDVALDWMIRRVNARTDLRLYWRGDVRGERWSRARQHEARRVIYKFWHSGIRAINGVEPRTFGRQTPVGMVKHEVPIGHMVHVSALERLGRIVPEDDRWPLYAPANLIAVLPAIESTYANPEREPLLRVVDWDGVPLDPKDAESARKVRELLALARDGLGPLVEPGG
jgi:hypothetical protein